MSNAATGSGIDDPARWLGDTPALDLNDPKVALKARSLTQLVAHERGKALAIYGFVKGLHFSMSYKLGVIKPREILQRGEGPPADKLGLLIAMLRIIGVPARMRLMQLDMDFMHGMNIFNTNPTTVRCVLEAWIDGQWVRTDTYMYDAGYVAGARTRLADQGLERGWGLHLHGDTSWNGRTDAYFTGLAYGQANLIPAEEVVFNDQAELRSSSYIRDTYGALPRNVGWNASVAASGKAVREVRSEADSPASGDVSPAPKPAG